MRNPNSTLGVSALTAIQKRLQRAKDFEKPGKRTVDSRNINAAKARAERQAEAKIWIAEVRKRKENNA